jgi:hypothetical protein
MKRVKTELRNRLNNNTLNSLLLVSMEGADPGAFGVKPVVKEGSKQKNRRLQLPVY